MKTLTIVTGSIVATSLLVATPLLAQSLGEKTGINSMLGTSPSTADFIKEAAIGDMFEIQASQLAAERAQTPAKSFASEMVTDHQKTSSDLKSIAASANAQADIPASLDSSHQKMLNKLEELQGADFTKQYVKDQVSAHKDAVSLFRRYAKSGDNTALKDWAGKTLPHLENHLAKAENLER